MILEFQTRAQRGYRDLVATGQSELATIVERCPNCRGPVVAAAPSRPVGLPERDEDARAQRREQLQPTAARLAHVVRDVLPEATFEIWIGPLVLDDVAGDTLFLAAPRELASWLADRYAPFLAQAATHLAGRHLRVEIYPADGASPTGTPLAELVADVAPTSGPQRGQAGDVGRSRSAAEIADGCGHVELRERRDSNPRPPA